MKRYILQCTVHIFCSHMNCAVYMNCALYGVRYVFRRLGEEVGLEPTPLLRKLSLHPGTGYTNLLDSQPTQVSIYSFFHLFIYSFIHLFIYSFIRFIHFIHLFIYSFFHFFIFSFIHFFDFC